MTADYFAIPTILDGMSTDRPKLLGIFYTFIRGQAKYSEDRKNFANSLDAAKREATVKGEEHIAELLGREFIKGSRI